MPKPLRACPYRIRDICWQNPAVFPRQHWTMPSGWLQLRRKSRQRNVISEPTDMIHDCCGQNAETYRISQRIKLNAKTLFMLSTFLSLSNLAVKSVTNPWKQQAHASSDDFIVNYVRNPPEWNQHADIGQNHGIIIISYHKYSKRHVKIHAPPFYNTW